MARKPSPSIRTTLYRLVELADLASAIKPKYLTRDEFSQNFVTVGEREALLVHGTMVTDIVSWASTAHGLTGCPIAGKPNCGRSAAHPQRGRRVGTDLRHGVSAT